jgi:hypothetical protein
MLKGLSILTAMNLVDTTKDEALYIRCTGSGSRSNIINVSDIIAFAGLVKTESLQRNRSITEHHNVTPTSYFVIDGYRGCLQHDKAI